MRRVVVIAAVAVMGCRAPINQVEQATSNVPLQLVNRLCSDSAAIGDVVPARVLASNTAGGLFAQLALRGVDMAQGIFHFEVVGLTALSSNMQVNAPAVSAPGDAERVAAGRVCVPAHAMVQAKIADEMVRFPRDP